MEIRQLNEKDDFDAISRIYAFSWKVAYQGIVPEEYLSSIVETQWSAYLAKGNSINLVMTDNKIHIGTSSVCPARDKKMNGWGEIISIYLLPEYFGKGYGGLLLDKSILMLRELGFDKVYLWVLQQNAMARRFYEKNGFTLTSDTMPINIGGKHLVELRYVKEGHQ